MAKQRTKPTAQDVLRKDGGAAYALDDEQPTETTGADETALYGFDCIALDSEGKPRQLVAQDTPMQQCAVVLSRGVLIALLDPSHELADAETAEKLWLLDEGEVTPIGALVIAGTDQTALRAKMAAAWRNAQNAKFVSKKD